MWEKRLSQNRSTCCGTSISSATSLIVRNASGAFSTIRSPRSRRLDAIAPGIDTLLEDSRRLEYHDAARGNRHFLAGLRIAADALAFFAHDERAERRQLYGLAALQAVGNFLEHELDERRRLGARQPNLLIDRLTQVRTRDRLSRHGQPRAP